MMVGVAYPQLMEAVKLGSLSVEEYLRGEPASEVRHEFVAGAVYAMAGASEEHNIIAGNVYSALRSFLQGKPCKVFMADMKVRLAVGGEELFYYPDVVVTCDSRDSERYYKKFPKVVVEVLSPEIERTDRREKLLAYTSNESLAEYVLVAQNRMEITALPREAQMETRNHHRTITTPRAALDELLYAASRRVRWCQGLEAVAYRGLRVDAAMSIT